MIRASPLRERDGRTVPKPFSATALLTRVRAVLDGPDVPGP